MTGRRWAREFTPLKLAAVVWVVAASIAIAYVIQRDNRQDREFRQGIVAEQSRQSAAAEMQARAQCSKWRDEAGGPVDAQTRDLGRVIVRTAAASYSLGECEQFFGPLGAVDPDAYRPAPAS